MPASPAAGGNSQVSAVRLACACSLALLALCPARAAAQAAATIGVDSAYRFRGHSLSARHPVATVDASYDDKSGLYVSGSGVFVLTGNDPGLLTVQGDLGFAKRLTPGLSFDLGVTRSEYTDRRGGPGSVHYTELYLGLSRRNVAVRVYYSPDYLHPGVGTLYGEASATFEPIAHWSLSAHAGKLAYLAHRPSFASRSGQYDWSLGVSRQLGALDLHAILSSGGPGEDYYTTSYHSRTAVTVGASYTF